MTSTDSASREPDISDPLDSESNLVETSVEELRARAVRLRNELTYGPETLGIEVLNGHIIDHGQIEDMVLPEGWVQSGSDCLAGGVATQSFREFHPADEPKAKLCFYYRGLPEAEDVGQRFRAVLDQEPHILDLEEVSSITEVLDDKGAEAFMSSVVGTEDLNGRRVLRVEGRYQKNQEDCLEIFVDASGDGRVIQEIFYQAPQDLYDRHIDQAKDSIRSIKWRRIG